MTQTLTKVKVTPRKTPILIAAAMSNVVSIGKKKTVAYPLIWPLATRTFSCSMSGMVTPVMKSDAGEAKNVDNPIMSSGAPTRPSGIVFPAIFRPSSVANAKAVIFEGKGPGAMQLKARSGMTRASACTTRTLTYS